MNRAANNLAVLHTSGKECEAGALPYYRPVSDECGVFASCWERHLPLMLKGPTGCGKSRFVEHMAARLDRPLVTVSCHDDTTATDLLGRYLLKGGETVWQDGPVTRALRQSAILYLDEVVEARSDVLVVIHSLTDHRRRLFVERHDEELVAGDPFMLVVSYNPGYTRGLKELKPSTRQRFVGIGFDWPDKDAETDILMGETGLDRNAARRLATLGSKFRKLEEFGLAEGASTRLLINAARLILSGLEPRRACHHAIVEALSDDP
ncbi:MAG: CbbQ/NirQ/NorQ/GpvN family protein, partial [Candidatus Cloacimonetes bacterium]|nr:CbbQ/NirQ/NorQ/GpvN family protein [Candidatus Cloacimonadota bacterium]